MARACRVAGCGSLLLACLALVCDLGRLASSFPRSLLLPGGGGGGGRWASRGRCGLARPLPALGSGSAPVGVGEEDGELLALAEVWVRKSGEARRAAVERARRSMLEDMDILKDRLMREVEEEKRKVASLEKENSALSGALKLAARDRDAERQKLVAVAKEAIQHRAAQVRREVVNEYRARRTALLEKIREEHAASIKEIRDYMKEYMIKSQQERQSLQDESKRATDALSHLRGEFTNYMVLSQAQVSATRLEADRLAASLAVTKQRLQERESEALELQSALRDSQSKLFELEQAFSSYMLSSHEDRLRSASDFQQARKESEDLRLAFRDYMVRAQVESSKRTLDSDSLKADLSQQREVISSYMIESHEEKLKAVEGVRQTLVAELSALQAELSEQRDLTSSYIIKSHEEKLRALAEVRKDFKEAVEFLEAELSQQKSFTSSYMISSHKNKLRMLARMQREARSLQLEAEERIKEATPSFEIAGKFPVLQTVSTGWPAHGRDCGP